MQNDPQFPPEFNTYGYSVIAPMDGSSILFPCFFVPKFFVNVFFRYFYSIVDLFSYKIITGVYIFLFALTPLYLFPCQTGF